MLDSPAPNLQEAAPDNVQEAVAFSRLWNTPEAPGAMNMRAAPEAWRECLEDLLTDFLDREEFEDHHGVYPVSFLVSVADRLMSAPSLSGYSDGDDSAGFRRALFARLRRASSDEDALFHAARERGVVRPAHLARLFPKDTPVAVDGPWGAFGGLVSSVSEAGTPFQPKILLQVGVVQVVDGVAVKGKVIYRFPSFRGEVAIASLPFRAIDPARPPEDLVAAGEAALRFCGTGTYAQYSGDLVQDSYWGSRRFRGEGRVIVDSVHFRQIQPDVWSTCASGSPLEGMERWQGQSSPTPANASSSAWMVWPWLYGFSMRSKRWGRMNAAQMAPVEWRDDAFDLLVLDGGVKDRLRRLVSHHGVNEGFRDIVADKGGGLVVLLSGAPGQGKTTLAESIAEVLRRPLYSVGVGELGACVEDMENALRNLLDVAAAWKAVVLIDEVDIFLQARDGADVARNAMVAVFLRMLEYQDGVMFLTTNRSSNLDGAVSSRIAVHFRFPEADAVKQARVWSNLLGKAGVPDAARQAILAMDKPAMNAREIKSAVRHAMTLARSEGAEVSPAHVAEFLSIRDLEVGGP